MATNKWNKKIKHRNNIKHNVKIRQDIHIDVWRQNPSVLSSKDFLIKEPTDGTYKVVVGLRYNLFWYQQNHYTRVTSYL